MSEEAKDKGEVRIGPVVRNGLPKTHAVPHETDGLAVKLENESWIPRYIYRGKLSPKPITGVSRDTNAGETVCFFGATSKKKKCGPILGVYGFPPHEGANEIYDVKVGGNFKTEPGDSGGPVWNEKTGKMVGVVSVRYPDGRRGFAPLLPSAGYPASQIPGILHAPGMERKPGVPSKLELETAP